MCSFTEITKLQKLSVKLHKPVRHSLTSLLLANVSILAESVNEIAAVGFFSWAWAKVLVSSGVVYRASTLVRRK